jgi:hypothetical protein
MRFLPLPLLLLLFLSLFVLSGCEPKCNSPAALFILFAPARSLKQGPYFAYSQAQRAQPENSPMRQSPGPCVPESREFFASSRLWLPPHPARSAPCAHVSRLFLLLSSPSPASPAPPAPRGNPARRVPQGLQGLAVLRALPVLKALPALRALPVLRALRGRTTPPRAPRVPPARRALQGRRALPAREVSPVQKVSRGRRAPRVSRAPRVLRPFHRRESGASRRAGAPASRR